MPAECDVSNADVEAAGTVPWGRDRARPNAVPAVRLVGGGSIVPPPPISLIPGNETQEGLIVGTAAYLRPEQARGQTIDKLTDIWALGCVLL
jgi:serine/threonine protein kinase